MENGFRARPKHIREQYESKLRETKEALGEANNLGYVAPRAQPALAG